MGKKSRRAKSSSSEDSDDSSDYESVSKRKHSRKSSSHKYIKSKPRSISPRPKKKLKSRTYDHDRSRYKSRTPERRIHRSRSPRHKVYRSRSPEHSYRPRTSTSVQSHLQKYPKRRGSISRSPENRKSCNRKVPKQRMQYHSRSPEYSKYSSKTYEDRKYSDSHPKYRSEHELKRKPNRDSSSKSNYNRDNLEPLFRKRTPPRPMRHVEVVNKGRDYKSSKYESPTHESYWKDEEEGTYKYYDRDQPVCHDLNSEEWSEKEIKRPASVDGTSDTSSQSADQKRNSDTYWNKYADRLGINSETGELQKDPDNTSDKNISDRSNIDIHSDDSADENVKSKVQSQVSIVSESYASDEERKRTQRKETAFQRVEERLQDRRRNEKKKHHRTEKNCTSKNKAEIEVRESSPVEPKKKSANAQLNQDENYILLNHDENFDDENFELSPKNKGEKKASEMVNPNKGTKSDFQKDTDTKVAKTVSKNEKSSNKIKDKKTDILTTRTGGAYIPPARLKMMQDKITDKSR